MQNIVDEYNHVIQLYRSTTLVFTRTGHIYIAEMKTMKDCKDMVEIFYKLKAR